ncbi:MAG TPA: ATP phosphoribosyltransferase regulatory subunit, partial [Armatimonadota bacterium]|nr:ATP phosphoribosyltransferase regulatory subunit [Armatimonadota bacterium]
MSRFSAPRGTQDILPSATPRWQFIESKIRETCRLYGFNEIRTPTFEETELFIKHTGESTDIVNKEMYTFTSRGGQSLTLRPE